MVFPLQIQGSKVYPSYSPTSVDCTPGANYSSPKVTRWNVLRNTRVHLCTLTYVDTYQNDTTLILTLVLRVYMWKVKTRCLLDRHHEGKKKKKREKSSIDSTKSKFLICLSSLFPVPVCPVYFIQHR